MALLVSGMALTLQACATPEPAAYGPIGEAVRYGYKDRANPDGGHTVLVVLPPQSPLAEARAYWDRRAGELCPGGVSKRIVFRSERNEVMSPAPYVQYGAGIGTRMTTAYELEGYVYCKAATPAG
ncbi:hypothetical protein [Phenylobacterium sp.]|uniref:hypothetical protein n=1 Tax=Phenylobacterium sp. TaxID=1871053 RepID=UPI002E3119FE|nr:hypothetical protein [Phenylobacterium sp.]HEX4711665.1 hypothetical protein [Phenylobacterium sp.]